MHTVPSKKKKKSKSRFFHNFFPHFRFELLKVNQSLSLASSHNFEALHRLIALLYLDPFKRRSTNSYRYVLIHSSPLSPSPSPAG
jgi:hypothetical protein